MNNYGHMTISEFSRFTGIKRDNLIFYDRIGLITPELRGDNGYRYYTQRQLATAFLVSSMRELKISTQTIKDYTKHRTPQHMLELLGAQMQKIDMEIKTLEQIKDIMELYTNITADALREDKTVIQIKKLTGQPVFYGPYLDGTEPYSDESLNAFYDYASGFGMALSYPLGIAFSKECLLRGNGETPQQFYFKLPRSDNQFKPGGTYVVGYLQGAYIQVETLYRQMLDFIRKRDLVICGRAYEEYPLNEISVQNENEYLIKVEIMVEPVQT